MTEPEIQAIYWALFQPRPTACRSCFSFLVFLRLRAYLLSSSLLGDSASLPIRKTAEILYHRDNLSWVWMSVRATVFVVAAPLLLVAYLVASAIHLELKTNTLMKMTQTTRPFSVWICLLSFSPQNNLCCFFFSFLGVFSLSGRLQKSQTGISTPLYMCISPAFLNIYIWAPHGPNFKLQLHLHN